MPGERRTGAVDFMPALATVDEVATNLRICRASVYKLINTGELRSVVLFGRHRRVYVDSYLEYLDRQPGANTNAENSQAAIGPRSAR
jgi:excisionase family DNA binding protein